MRQLSIQSIIILLALGLTGCKSLVDNRDSVLLSNIENKKSITADESKKQSKRKKTLSLKELNEEEQPAVDISHKYKYKVRGKHYKVFASAKNFQEIGNASWYGPGFHGKKTANGERYNMYAMTAAHKTLPLGSKVRVTNLSNRRKIIVRINDRGPFHGGRIIDLSKAAAKKLGIIGKGYAKVHIKIVK